MDLATIVAKMSQYGGLLPPGSDKVIKLMKEYPRSTVAVGSFVVIVTLWDRFIDIQRSFKVIPKVIPDHLGRLKPYKEILQKTKISSSMVGQKNPRYGNDEKANFGDRFQTGNGY